MRKIVFGLTKKLFLFFSVKDPFIVVLFFHSELLVKSLPLLISFALQTPALSLRQIFSVSLGLRTCVLTVASAQMELCAASTAVDNDAEIRPITTGAQAQVKQMNPNSCSTLKVCP